MSENTLYFGDNLQILRENIREETVDLIYLDPPFVGGADSTDERGSCRSGLLREP